MLTMNRMTLVLAVLFAGLLGEGCKRGKVYSAPPAVGGGVRIEAKNVRVKGKSVVAELVAFNDTDDAIIINRNQIAVVGPDGVDNYRRGSREVHILPARGKHNVHVDTEVNAAAWKNAPGFYLRFDGFYAGDMRLGVPPMAVGQPTHQPGHTNQSFAAPTLDATKPGVVKRVASAVKGEPAAPPPDDGIKTYRGPRRTLRTPGVKCAAMPLKTKKVADQMVFIMDELLLTELQQSGFEAIGPDDINAMIGFEKTKEAVGCDEMSCVAEIGAALGVDYLAAGNVAALDGSMVLTLKLIDVRNTKVLSRVNKVADGGEKGLPRMIAEAVQELVERSQL